MNAIEFSATLKLVKYYKNEIANHEVLEEKKTTEMASEVPYQTLAGIMGSKERKMVTRDE